MANATLANNRPRFRITQCQTNGRDLVLDGVHACEFRVDTEVQSFRRAPGFPGRQERRHGLGNKARTHERKEWGEVANLMEEAQQLETDAIVSGRFVARGVFVSGPS